MAEWTPARLAVLRDCVRTEVTNHGLTAFEHSFLVEQRVQTYLLSGVSLEQHPYLENHWREFNG